MPNLTEATVAARPARVLVVEDDFTSREYLRIALRRHGFEVLASEGVPQAQTLALEQGLESFDAVVTDYRMPGQTGLDLLDWLQRQDAGLATIILTAEGEKELVTKSLRSGATDFLEKPVDLPKLLGAIRKARDQTRHQRSLARSESAVKKLGRAQTWMIQSGQAAGREQHGFHVDVCFHPKLEAGGDFFSHFKPTADKHSCLLTDVSGHDLQAAYISAYFQGIVRGMLQGSASVAEIFGYFNNFLLQEWNSLGQDQGQAGLSTSLAASSVVIDTRQQTADILICGAPVPLQVRPDGRVVWTGDAGGAPLGWFEEFHPRSHTISIVGGGMIHLWTDGLEDLAVAQQVSPLALAFALEQARDQKTKLPLLDLATDDILFATIHLPDTQPSRVPHRPILAETYHGGQTVEIDQLEASWRRNLRMACPRLAEATEHDLLLASREAVLNAFKHGCRNDPESKVRFQISYDRLTGSFLVWIEDPGPGHDFDIQSHAQAAADSLLDEHRGLIFISNLAQRVQFENHGASLILEFRTAP